MLNVFGSIEPYRLKSWTGRIFFLSYMLLVSELALSFDLYKYTYATL